MFASGTSPGPQIPRWRFGWCEGYCSYQTCDLSLVLGKVQYRQLFVLIYCERQTNQLLEGCSKDYKATNRTYLKQLTVLCSSTVSLQIMPIPPSTINHIINAYFSAFSAMNAAQWSELFTPDAQVYDPVGNPPSNPQTDSKPFFDILQKKNESLVVKPESVFIVGNEAAVKWSLQATNKSHKEASAEGISIFEVSESGKIQKVCAYWDDKAFLAQLQT